MCILGVEWDDLFRFRIINKVAKGRYMKDETTRQPSEQPTFLAWATRADKGHGGIEYQQFHNS